MSEGSQILVPPSFTALFVPPGRIKPTESYAVIEQRYELCEDFAQLLVDQAQARHWELGITEADVLERMAQGLSASDVFSALEAQWVLRRLAELLGWEAASGECRP
jgi:hypothetical protein